MKKLSLIILLSVFFISGQAYAKKEKNNLVVPVKLTFDSGKSKVYYGNLEEFFYNEKDSRKESSVYVKESPEGEFIKIPHTTVTAIEGVDNPNLLWLNTNLYRITTEDTASKEKQWVKLRYRNSQIEWYTYESVGAAVGTTTGQNQALMQENTFFKRKQDKYPRYAGRWMKGGVGWENHFRKSAAIYFADQPEFVKRIEKKEFKYQKMEEMLDAYEQYINENEKK